MKNPEYNLKECWNCKWCYGIGSDQPEAICTLCNNHDKWQPIKEKDEQ